MERRRTKLGLVGRRGVLETGKRMAFYRAAIALRMSLAFISGVRSNLWPPRVGEAGMLHHMACSEQPWRNLLLGFLPPPICSALPKLKYSIFATLFGEGELGRKCKPPTAPPRLKIHKEWEARDKLSDVFFHDMFLPLYIIMVRMF